MSRKLLLSIVSCILATGLHAQTTRVLRFVPVSGSETEVAQNTLRKVIFTPDSIVLIAASDGEATPMYKYDYRSILFTESGSEGMEEVGSETVSTVRSEKFIKNGQLYIRYKGRMYDVQGRAVEIKN